MSCIPRLVSLIPRLSEPSSYYILKNEHWSVKAALLSGSVRMLQVLYSMCVTNDTIVQNVFLTSFAGYVALNPTNQKKLLQRLLPTLLQMTYMCVHTLMNTKVLELPLEAFWYSSGNGFRSVASSTYSGTVAEMVFEVWHLAHILVQ